MVPTAACVRVYTVVGSEDGAVNYRVITDSGRMSLELKEPELCKICPLNITWKFTEMQDLGSAISLNPVGINQCIKITEVLSLLIFERNTVVLCTLESSAAS